MSNKMEKNISEAWMRRSAIPEYYYIFYLALARYRRSVLASDRVLDTLEKNYRIKTT